MDPPKKPSKPWDPERSPIPSNVDWSRNVNSLWCAYIVSVLSACNAEIVTYPLDLIKTRLQIQGEKAAGTLGQAPHRGMMKTTLGVAKEEGVLALWRGIEAMFLRHLIYSGTRMVVYRKIRELIVAQHPDAKTFTLFQSTVAGAASGAFAQYVATPADLVKVQMQMEGKRRLLGLPPRVHGIGDAFAKIWKSGGIITMWTGSVPSVWRAALVTIGDFTGYDMSKRFILKRTPLQDNWVTHILASICAGLTAAILGTPADTIKTRVMNQPMDAKGRGTLYRNSIDCVKKTIMQEGAPALYKGFLPMWLRLAPWALTFWVTYEQIMRIIGAKQF